VCILPHIFTTSVFHGIGHFWYLLTIHLIFSNAMFLLILHLTHTRILPLLDKCLISSYLNILQVLLMVYKLHSYLKYRYRQSQKQMCAAD
jgi:hypothetical protein